MLYGYTALTTINLSEGNNNYESDNGVLFSKDKITLIQYPAGKKKDTYDIPEQVTSIGSDTFEGCHASSLTMTGKGEMKTMPSEISTELTNVVIGEGITSIVNNAFSGCASIKSLNIPSGITFIHEKAFSGCVPLSSISLSDGNESFMLDNGVLYTKNKDTIVFYPSGKTEDTFTIRFGVRTIKSYAFDKAQNVVAVKIPESIEQIQDNAFSECAKLERLEFYGITPPECNKDAFDAKAIRVFVLQDYNGDTFCSADADKSSSRETGSSGLSGGAIAGIIIGVIVVVIVIIVVAVYVWQRKKTSHQSTTEMSERS